MQQSCIDGACSLEKFRSAKESSQALELEEGRLLAIREGSWGTEEWNRAGKTGTEPGKVHRI